MEKGEPTSPLNWHKSCVQVLSVLWFSCIVFFGGKLGEFQTFICVTTFASLVYRCEWVYAVVDENRATMRKEEGGILSQLCLKKMENLDRNQWNASVSGADGRYL
jgi:hypothetical protein